MLFGARAGRRSDETIERTQGNDYSDAHANNPFNHPVFRLVNLSPEVAVGFLVAFCKLGKPDEELAQCFRCIWLGSQGRPSIHSVNYSLAHKRRRLTFQ